MPQHIEIMAPAGSFAALTAAIQAGADAVYFGVGKLNMRARAANNFEIEDLPQIVNQCTADNVRSYLTLNTILYDHDMPNLQNICDAAKTAGVTAIIASDIAAISYAHSIGLEVHISTQQNVTNIETIKFFSAYADTVVLARELTLKQIASICHAIQKQDIRGPKGDRIQIEIFAHGAMCIAHAGVCNMSLVTENASANRGACLQNCRHAFKVTDKETNIELDLENEYIMSPKDLCTIGFLDKIIDAGVSILKLEGRGRSPDYVHTVTRVYREAVTACQSGEYSREKIEEWTEALKAVYNRGFWHGGYYLGKRLAEWSGKYGSQATTEKIFIGKAKKYYPKAGIGMFTIDTNQVAIGDTILVTGPSTGVLEQKIESIYVNEKPARSAKKGDECTIPFSGTVRKNDKLFKIVPRHNA
jgi:putative protease